MTISPEQCKAARELLGRSRANCGKAAGFGPSTAYIFERGTVRPSASLRPLSTPLSNPSASSSPKEASQARD
jgi:hypothetical protein